MISANERLVRRKLPGIEVIWGYGKGHIGYLAMLDNKPFSTYVGFQTSEGVWDWIARDIESIDQAQAKPKGIHLAIDLDNLTPAQALAIQDMLAQWASLAQMGSSRYVCFYVDGDGNFHPKILVEGKKPKFFGTPEEVKARWKGDDYRIDYDEIAWKLRKDE